MEIFSDYNYKFPLNAKQSIRKPKNSFPFMEPKGSLHIQRQPPLGNTLEADKSDPHHKTIFKINFNIIPPSQFTLF
jgi:hypothetical protein